ncbi:hypothetical protein ANN_27165, partial [Periplaneta americana]
STSQKLYLEANWQSKIVLFEELKKYCALNELQKASMNCLMAFEEENLSLFSPKKERCDLCCAYKAGNITQEEYSQHILRKDQARKEKETDKNGSTKLCTMDLQAFLLSSFLKSSALYYKTNFSRPILPGNKAGDPTVTHLRYRRYNPSGVIDYKHFYEDDWQPLPKRMNNQNKPDTSVPRLYNELIKVNTEKFVHLQQLKCVIPRDFHPFYNNLPHVCSDKSCGHLMD